MNCYKINEWVCFTELELAFPLFESDGDEKQCYLYTDGSKKHPCILPKNEHFDSVLKQGVKGLYAFDIKEEALEGMPCINLSYFENESPLLAIEHLKAWQDLFKKKKKVQLLGLGDVGATLALGLKLLSGEEIETLGIFDLNEKAIKRWTMELNQVISNRIQVVGLEEKDLFNCDVFIFCASKNIPKVGEAVTDVRMAQYEENAKLIEHYARISREKGFKGLFLVVSDPVDLLCKKLYESSQVNESGVFDGKGLKPDQIRGYGLGVMHGRALYYSDLNQMNYASKGRVFGPHGQALVVVENIEKEDLFASEKLTHAVVTSNLEMRSLGYKPYIAPALSSGAISILATFRGEFHHVATYLEGQFWGTKQKNTLNGPVFEGLMLSEETWVRVKRAYEYLEDTWATLN